MLLYEKERRLDLRPDVSRVNAVAQDIILCGVAVPSFHNRRSMAYGTQSLITRCALAARHIEQLLPE
jgi:hypothetical protein